MQFMSQNNVLQRDNSTSTVQHISSVHSSDPSDCFQVEKNRGTVALLISQQPR